MTKIVDAIECQELLDFVTPDLYRKNLHRVLGLSLGSSSADVRRQQKRLEMQRKLGIGMSVQNQEQSPLACQPTPEDIDMAMDRLNNPKARLLDELFWFWPTNGEKTDQALDALSVGNTEAAQRLWTDQVKLGGDRAQIAIHNQTVLRHLVILDHELEAGKMNHHLFSTGKSDNQWTEVFDGWWAVCQGETFWIKLEKRVREIDDIQLKRDFVSSIRHSLPKALLLVNAQLACKAAQNGHFRLAKQHIGMVESAAKSKDLNDDVLREALKPFRTRLKASIDTARNRWVSAPQQGRRHILDLHDQTTKILTTVDLLLTQESPIRSGLHDMVAEAIFDGQLSYSTKTEEWDEGIKLLEMAQDVAVGETIKGRIADHIRILRDNSASGNDWCSPGYWDLPDEIIASLEAARKKVKAGNFDGSIEDLAVLDLGIGKPLRRALGYSLSHKGTHVFHDALNEVNKGSSAIEKIMAKLKGMSTYERERVFLMYPESHTPSYMLPSCLCCGSSNYSRWVNFTYKEIPLFMCSSCNEADDREREQRKDRSKVHVRESMEYMLLADEVDPGDQGVKRNLATIKKFADDIGCTIPGTKALKDRLGKSKLKGTREYIAQSAEENTCYFCDTHHSDSQCQIVVPMSGEQKRTKLIFGEGLEYLYGDVIVPRCSECRDEHKQYPLRVASWQKASSAAASESKFPEYAQAVKDAEEFVRKAEDAEKQARKPERFPELVTEVSSSMRITEDWKSNVNELRNQLEIKQEAIQKILKSYRDGMSFMAFPIALIVLTIFNSKNLDTPVIVVFLLLFAILAILQMLKSRAASNGASKTEQLQKDLADAKETAVTAQNILKAVQQRLVDAQDKSESEAKEVTKERIAILTDARRKLESAQENAIAIFERNNPCPSMAAGIRSEGAYADFRVIKAMKNRGWKFGKDPGESSEQPSKVSGLVG
jgi:hypothetical protein